MISKGYLSTPPLEDLFEKVSQIQLATHYLGVASIPSVISSPLRKDKNPSLGIYTLDGQTVNVKDFATGYSSSLLGLLMLMWNYNKEELRVRLWKDFNNLLTSNTKISISRNPKKTIVPSSTKLEVLIRNWQQHDLEYWNSYGISEAWLKFGKIFPISHIFSIKNGISHVFPAEKYAYVYIENKHGISIKIYQPFSTRFKWQSKHDSSVWDLWQQLPPQGEKLIITSSRKDALTIWANTGIPACSLQAESYWPKEHVVNELKERFKNIYILYDNDYTKEPNAGHVFGEAIANRFQLKQIEIPIELEAKDSSDLYKKHGKEIFIKTILNLLT